MAGTLDSMTRPALGSDLSVSAEVRESNGRPCTVVTLTGRADDAGQARLRAALHAYSRWGPGFVLIDLSAVPIIDVTGVRELVRVLSVMEGRGGVVALISPQPAVRAYLEACGADQLMSVYQSVAEAMAG